MASSIQNKRLAMYLEAEKAILSGQSYTIGNRQLTRASLSTVQQTIDALIASGATVEGETNNSRMARRVVFIDGR